MVITLDAAAQKALAMAASRNEVGLIYQVFLFTYRGLLQQLRIIPGTYSVVDAVTYLLLSKGLPLAV